MADSTEELQNNAAGGEVEGGEQEETNEGPAPEVIAEATKLGWSPKEKFRGDPERWVDADEFVERGRTVLPIVKAQNRRLEEQNQQLTEKLQAQQTQLEELTDSIKAMQEIGVRETKGRIDRQIQSTHRQIEEARTERDTDRVVELQGQLDALKEEKGKLETPPEKKVEKKVEKEETRPNQVKLDREFQEWQAENDWFGEDKIRTRLANAISLELRKDPEFKNTQGREFLDEVTRQVEESIEEMGGKPEPRRQVGKTSGGSQSGARIIQERGTKKGKSFNDLPPDARAACNADAERLVGPNKVYKKKEDYVKFYVETYFGEEA